MLPSKFSSKIKQVTSPLKGSIPTIKTYKLSVKKRFEGTTILDFYTQAMPSVSREVWEDKIESKNLTVAGKPVKTNHIVKAGEITQHTSQPIIESTVNTNIELLEWNNNFIIINKPAPLPMHSGGRFEHNTLSEILKIAFPKENFKLVHRIDANTTGIVVIAKNKVTANHLITQFKNQTVQKEYLALVEGIVPTETFTLNKSIGKEITASGGRKVNESGKIASTEFKVLKKYPKKNQTLLSVIPQTGRTNQIRIHLANIGNPIVGDIGYKDKNYFKNNPLTYVDDCLFLHAWKLSFLHLNIQYTFEASIPNKFKNNPIIKQN